MSTYTLTTEYQAIVETNGIITNPSYQNVEYMVVDEGRSPIKNSGKIIVPGAKVVFNLKPGLKLYVRCYAIINGNPIVVVSQADAPPTIVNADGIPLYIWQANTRYRENDCVICGTIFARCIYTHSSSDNFNTDLAYWSVLNSSSGITTITIANGSLTYSDGVNSASVTISASTDAQGNIIHTTYATALALQTLSNAVEALSGNFTSHDHDDRYYTETEVDTLLGGKSGTDHTHDTRYYTESEIDTLLAGKSDADHTHNDIYYTETEVDTLLSGKSDTSHDHDSRYYTESEIDTLLSTMLPTGYDLVVEADTDETTGDWYRLYKSGWVEQGGVWSTATDTATNYTVTLPKEMADTTYHISVIGDYEQTSSFYLASVNTTDFTVNNVYNDNGLARWYVCGNVLPANSEEPTEPEGDENNG